jgi:hypothetical protein
VAVAVAVAAVAGSCDRGAADRSPAVLPTVSGWTSGPMAETLGVQLLDLPLARLLRVDADARIERPRGVVQQLLLEAAPPLRAPA